jgi:imidazolonepropionase-like amidohydrolase
VTLPPNTEVLDLTGLTLMPGLIDCHDHLAAKSYGLASRLGIDEPLSLQHLRTAKVLEQTLAAGYTCVRDAGGLDLGFKQAVEQGVYPGPRLVLSVAIISPTGGLGDRVTPSGHPHPLEDPMLPPGVADGVNPVRAKVRQMARVGADVIKFATTGGASSRPGHGPRDQAFGPDEVRALIDEARALGRRTMCHAVGGPGLRMCVEAGAHSIEHGCYLAEDPDLIKMMADQGSFLVPTFEIYEFHATISPEYMRERSRALADRHRETLHLALAAGVRVVAGTDAGGYVHGDNAREVQILVERGMSPMQAIQSCTGWAAACVGLEQDIGTVARGKYADLLALEGDPLRDIETLRQQERFRLVMKGGEAFINRLGNQTGSPGPQPT